MEQENEAEAMDEQQTKIENISAYDWSRLFDAYKQIDYSATGEVIPNDNFEGFHELLYDLKLVFNFPWQHWTEGIQNLKKENYDFSTCSALELSMYLTAIFRSDRFDDVSIHTHFKNGNIKSIMDRLNQLI